MNMFKSSTILFAIFCLLFLISSIEAGNDQFKLRDSNVEIHTRHKRQSGGILSGIGDMFMGFARSVGRGIQGMMHFGGSMMHNIMHGQFRPIRGNRPSAPFRPRPEVIEPEPPIINEPPPSVKFVQSQPPPIVSKPVNFKPPNPPVFSSKPIIKTPNLSSVGNTNGFSTSGNTFTSSGNTFSTSGNTFSTSGNTFSSSGNSVLSSGNTFSSSGNSVSSSGNIFPSSGNGFSTSSNSLPSSGNSFPSSGSSSFSSSSNNFPSSFSSNFKPPPISSSFPSSSSSSSSSSGFSSGSAPSSFPNSNTIFTSGNSNNNPFVSSNNNNNNNNNGFGGTVVSTGNNFVSNSLTGNSISSNPNPHGHGEVVNHENDPHYSTDDAHILRVQDQRLYYGDLKQLKVRVKNDFRQFNGKQHAVSFKRNKRQRNKKFRRKP